MKFKHPELKEQFWKLTPRARHLACYMEDIIWQEGKEMMITCIYYEGGSGIHSQWRAFDIRSTDLTYNQIVKITEFVNYDFVYDVDRPNLKSVIHHKVDSKKIKDYKLKDFVPQYHLHCQVWIK